MANKIQLRRDSAANWQSTNPTLAQGEVGIDLTSNKIKIGNGTTAWNGLPYFDDKETVFTAVNSSIIPSENNVYDLGSPSKQWRHIYVSEGSFYIDNIKLSNVDGKLTVTAVTNPGQINEAPVEGGEAAYQLPVASSTVLGSIRVGNNLTIDEEGVLSAEDGDYTLPIASDTVLGGIKIGANLTIDETGTVDAVVPDVSSFITVEDIPAIPADISDLTDTEGLLSSSSTGNILFDGNDISNSVDNEIFVTTEKTITTNNSYTNDTDFSTDIDIGGGTIVPGWTQRNLEQIEFSFFGPTEFRSFLTGLILGRTVIVTYSTADGNQTLTGLLTQQFININEQEDPSNPGWVRVAGRIDATLPVDQTGIVSVNFPVYSLLSNSWEFDTDGNLTLPLGGDLLDSNGDSVLGESRVKLQSPGDRRIEEVYGYKEVSVTEPGTVNLTTTASRDSDDIARIWIDTTTTTIDEILDDTDAAGITDTATIEFSLDNTTWYTVGGTWFDGDERGYGVNIGGDTLVYSQGDTVYFRYVAGGAPVVWWDKNELPGGSSDFRGAVIDYHAYTGESTIIGTIHIVDDDGEDHITHTEVQSGSTDGENDDLWYVTTEGRIRYRRIDGESKTLKIQWTAKVFYGSEAYD